MSYNENGFFGSENFPEGVIVFVDLPTKTGEGVAACPVLRVALPLRLPAAASPCFRVPGPLASRLSHADNCPASVALHTNFISYVGATG